MIGYVDILYSTSKILKENFPNHNIYIDNNKQQVGIPSFYIQVVPVINKSISNKYRYKITDLYITYVDKKADNTLKLNTLDDMCEYLEEIPIYNSKDINKIVSYFNIIERKITNTIDPTIKISFQYFDTKREPIKENEGEMYEALMEILSLNLKTIPPMNNAE